MQKVILAALGLYALGAVWKFEKDNDGTLIALSPFIAAVGLLLLSRKVQEELGSPPAA